MPDEQPLLFASASDATIRLAGALGTEFAPLPPTSEPGAFEAWRAEAVRGPARSRIAVAVWSDASARAELAGVDAANWRQRFELPYLLWNFALGAAGRRCADGGAIVALVRKPAALDAAGWTPESAVADGVLALVRSVGAAEGARGVRANLVTTSIGLVEAEGAVRVLLSPDSVGLTGRVLAADGGRFL